MILDIGMNLSSIARRENLTSEGNAGVIVHKISVRPGFRPLEFSKKKFRLRVVFLFE